MTKGNGESDDKDFDEEPTSPSRPSNIRALRDEGDDAIPVADAFIVDALGRLDESLERTLQSIRDVRSLVRIGGSHPHVFEELADKFDDTAATAAGAARALRRQP